jgi:hypothetical protein
VSWTRLFWVLAVFCGAGFFLGRQRDIGVRRPQA